MKYAKCGVGVCALAAPDSDAAMDMHSSLFMLGDMKTRWAEFRRALGVFIG
jgi:hypothetical protein